MENPVEYLVRVCKLYENDDFDDFVTKAYAKESDILKIAFGIGYFCGKGKISSDEFLKIFDNVYNRGTAE